VLFDSPTYHCHNVETFDKVGTARINMERRTPRIYSGGVM